MTICRSVSACRLHIVTLSGRSGAGGGAAYDELGLESQVLDLGAGRVAGPVEATALGNVLVQGRTLGAVSGSLEDLRSLIARTHDLARYEPRA